MSDFLEFFSTNSLSWEQLEYGINKGLYNLHYGLIHKNLPTQVELNLCTFPTIIPEYNPKKYTTCKEGDIVFADASEDTNDVGKAVEFLDCATEKVICGLHTIHGRDKKQLTVNGFKGYAFASLVFRQQIRRLAQGTKIYSISPKNFNECHIGLPSKEEQSRIAKLLYLIDERISTQNKIIEELKKLKAVIMNGLYNSQEVGAGMRFPKFTEGWAKTTLGDITNNFNRRNKERASYPMYSVTNNQGFVAQSEKFGDREMVGEDVGSYKIINPGEFAYNPARINVGSIARYDGEVPCMISSLYVCFRLKDGIDSKWALYLLKSAKINFYYDVYGEGGVRVYLFYPNFARIKVSVPELGEQEKIGQFLVKIGERIDAEMNLNSKYQKQKAYLLKHMFI